MDLYKFAAQNGLRFPSSKGLLTVEQLFHLPLLSTTGAADLNSVAKSINGSLKTVSEESFVGDVEQNPHTKELRVCLDIVKDVIATKQDENKAELARRNKVVERKKILDALAAKKDAQLTTASVEELEKKLAELD